MSATGELQALVKERVRAVREKDVETLAARPAADVVTFDVLPPLSSRGSRATTTHLQEWFDGYRGRIGYAVHDLQYTPRTTSVSARSCTTSPER